MARGRVKITPQLILDAADGNGTGTAIRVAGMDAIQLQIGSTGSGEGVVRIQGSQSGTNIAGNAFQDVAPDFSATRTVDNHWDYVAAYDLQDVSTIAGDTGVVMAGDDEDNVRNLVINVNGLEWLNATVSDYVAGEITVKVIGFIPN